MYIYIHIYVYTVCYALMKDKIGIYKHFAVYKHFHPHCLESRSHKIL